MDPVAGMGHCLHLGSWEEPPDLSVVAGAVRRREGRAEEVKVGGFAEKRNRAGRREHMSPHTQGCFWILRHPLPTPKPSPRQDP